MKNEIGEINYNAFGSEMILINYNSYRDVDVYFPKYDWTCKHNQYNNFKKGLIKFPYEPRLHGVGYIGEGKYNSKEHKRHYRTWMHMLERCYNSKFHENNSSYIKCEVFKDWLNFQNFAKWYDDNFYQLENEVMHLDKDILYKHNKIYSPKTCIFAPQNINILFIKSEKSRGDAPIGVYWDKIKNVFIAKGTIFENGKSKTVHLGRYNNSNDAFQSYKNFKENHLKEIANLYKDRIPQKLYDALINYKVEITD